MVEAKFQCQRRVNKYICIQNQILELIMKHKSLSLLALSLLAGSVYAQGMTYNIGVVNNYLYRGITQTRGEPAVQGGLDYAHKSGLYVGAWASSIKWIEDNSTTTVGVTGPTELDIYGGYKFDLAPNTTMDLGFLRYEYLNNTLVKNTAYSNANTDELYVGLSTPLFNVKFSYAMSNLFGQRSSTAGANSTGATYTEFSREFDLGSGYKLTPKAGMTSMNSKVTDANGATTSYNDYSLTLTKDLQKGLALSVGYSGTNASKSWYVSNFNGKYLGDQAAVVGLKYNF
jgi:uncharacterized protein (TIGR02001 family)